MAQGFDNRPTGRQSFAFDTQAPVQRRSAAQAIGPQAGVRGGESQGGVVNLTPQTDTTGQSSIPAFLEEALAPQLKARQEQKFYEGALKAHSQEAMNDIAEKRPKWADVFGPTYYEQGAAFYSSQQAVSQYFADKMANMDQLAQMTPDEVRKMLVDEAPGLMTKSDTANLFIQKGLLDGSGPLMDQYTKARYALQQRETKASQFDSWNAAADLFNGQEKAYDLMGDSVTPEASAEQELSRNNFRGLLDQPPGQTDASYVDNLNAFGRSMLQNKQFRAYALFKASPNYARLSPDQQNQLDLMQDRFEKDANKQAASQFTDDMLRESAKLNQYDVFLHMSEADQKALVASGRYTPPSPQELMENRRRINKAIQLDAGTSQPYFDEEGVRNIGTSMIELQAKAQKDQLSEQRQDRRAQASIDAQKELKVWEAQQKATNLQQAVAAGTVGNGLANGLFDRDQWNIVSQQMYTAGNLDGLVRAYEGNAPMDTLRGFTERTLDAGLGKGYTNSFDGTLNTFMALRDKNVGAAMEIYGKHYEELSKAADLAVQGESPEAVYDKTFGPKAKDAAQFFPGLTYKRIDAIRGSVDKALTDLSPSFLGFRSSSPLSDASRFSLQPVILEALSTRFKGREPTDIEVKATVDNLIKSGRVSAYGQYGWVQAGTNPQRLHEAVGVDPQTLTVMLPQAIHEAFGPELAKKSPENHITEIVPVNTPRGLLLHLVYSDPATGHIEAAELSAEQLRARRQVRDRAAIERHFYKQPITPPIGPMIAPPF